MIPFNGTFWTRQVERGEVTNALFAHPSPFPQAVPLIRTMTEFTNFMNFVSLKILFLSISNDLQLLIAKVKNLKSTRITLVKVVGSTPTLEYILHISYNSQKSFI